MSEGSLAYLDTSAFVKLIAAEPESAALEGELRGWPQAVTSELLEIEARRFARRFGEGVGELIDLALRHLTLIPIGAEIRRLAGAVDPPELRTLDAIHLATAISVASELGALFSYDRRLNEAAKAAGLPCRSPG